MRAAASDALVEPAATSAIASEISDWFQQALTHHQAGRLPQAESLYRAILAQDAAHADALHLLGVIAHQVGQHTLAAELIRQAIAAKPGQAVYHTNLGNVCKAQGDLSAAQVSYRAALAISPDHAQAHNNLGNALLEDGQADAAESAYRAALAYSPAYVEAYTNLGHALTTQGRYAEAVSLHQQALALKPGHVEALNHLGNAQLGLGQTDAARHSYEQAIALQPAYAKAHNNLGYWHQDQGHFAEAAACFRQAFALNPGYLEALNNLGYTLAHQDRLDEALACFRQARDLDPSYVAAQQNLLFHLNLHAASTPADYLNEARRFGAQMAAQVSAYTCWPVEAAHGTGQPLRIGFVSGDLRAHPVGYFLESVVAHLPAQQFQLFAYATQLKTDALTERLKPRFNAWRSLAGLSDAAAAAKIHADGLHILVDLAGHTAGSRLPVFAWQPAPVQVAWLGYFASTGVAAIDYIIADPQVLPESEEAHFVERPWRLPDCYLCFTPPQDALEVGPLPQRDNGIVTFGCFNRLSKMNHAVVALWSRVLQAVPGSRLLLKAKELNDPTMQQLTRTRFAAHGIAPERLELTGYSSRTDYLAHYKRLDIALDPFPYPGGTTTVEALWMGVPVLSRRGERFLSHAGESLLHTVGLDEWVAADNEDYVAKAQAYAADVKKLAELRAGLRAQLLASPLCDAPRFAANLGAAFEGMWRQHQAHTGAVHHD